MLRGRMKSIRFTMYLRVCPYSPMRPVQAASSPTPFQASLFPGPTGLPRRNFHTITPVVFRRHQFRGLFLVGSLQCWVRLALGFLCFLFHFLLPVCSTHGLKMAAWTLLQYSKLCLRFLLLAVLTVLGPSHGGV